MMNKLFRALLVLTHVVVFTYAVASASFESDIIIPETDDPQLRVISSSSSPRPEKAEDDLAVQQSLMEVEELQTGPFKDSRRIIQKIEDEKTGKEVKIKTEPIKEAWLSETLRRIHTVRPQRGYEDAIRAAEQIKEATYDVAEKSATLDGFVQAPPAPPAPPAPTVPTYLPKHARVTTKGIWMSEKAFKSGPLAHHTISKAPIKTAAKEVALKQMPEPAAPPKPTVSTSAILKSAKKATKAERKDLPQAAPPPVKAAAKENIRPLKIKKKKVPKQTKEAAANAKKTAKSDRKLQKNLKKIKKEAKKKAKETKKAVMQKVKKAPTLKLPAKAKGGIKPTGGEKKTPKTHPSKAPAIEPPKAKKGKDKSKKKIADLFASLKRIAGLSQPSETHQSQTKNSEKRQTEKFTQAAEGIEGLGLEVSNNGFRKHAKPHRKRSKVGISNLSFSKQLQWLQRRL